MNCPDCGIAVEKTDRFCPKCFARIEPPSLWRRLVSLFQGSSSPAENQKTASAHLLPSDHIHQKPWMGRAAEEQEKA